MISQTLSQIDLTIYPKISLVIFLVVYFFAVFWILHPRQKKVAEQIASSILENDQPAEFKHER